MKDIVAGKKYLIFVLNGAATAFPPQVLVTEKPATANLREAAWLVRDRSVTMMPTVFNSEDEEQIMQTAPRGFASFHRGNTTDLAGLSSTLIRLPATADEVRSVAASLQAPEIALIMRDASTEASYKQMQLDRFDILCFATHGLVAVEFPDVAKSGAEALAFSLLAIPTQFDDGF